MNVDLNNKEIQPAILAGILNVPATSIYQFFQEGKLPSRQSKPTYYDCIHHYLDYYRKKSTKTNRNLLEEKVKAEIKLSQVKQATLWLAYNKDAGELIDANEFLELIQPVFTTIQDNLNNISEQFPETREKINHILKDLATTGNRLEEQCIQEKRAFIENKLNEELLPDVD